MFENSQSRTAKALFGYSLPELRELMKSFDQPAYRATQLASALYRERVETIGEILTLPVSVRQALERDGYRIGLPELAQTAHSKDGTERYLVRLGDAETVETVWMPEGDLDDLVEENEETSLHGREEDAYRRATICVSSQVGCAVNCQFCLTAKLGVRRNLTAGEIAGQVAAVLNRHNVEVGSARGQGNPARINLVFMGMGEPFLNYENFISAVHLLTGPMQIPESRITVSTSGILPGIERYATEPVRPKLALSLNASNDAARVSIMPITRKWNISTLLRAVSAIPLRAKERITFEYVLLKGINDQPQHAEELVALLRKMPAMVNLIVWNAGPDMPFEAPSPDRVAAFQGQLRAAGLPAFIRRPRGADIYAACGQLKRTVETMSPLDMSRSGALVSIAPAAIPRG